jgi:hypothetical protein
MSPLSVNQGSQSTNIMGDINEMSDQVKGQTAQFGSLLKDPNFSGQSEMGAMLKLQREVAQEQMMYQTVSNVMKARTDSSKNAIQNMR